MAKVQLPRSVTHPIHIGTTDGWLADIRSSHGALPRLHRVSRTDPRGINTAATAALQIWKGTVQIKLKEARGTDQRQRTAKRSCIWRSERFATSRCGSS